MTNAITVQAIVKAPAVKVWEYWNKPEHITGWAFANEGWEALKAENDLRVGGNFKISMSAKDRSHSFDFAGTYTAVKENQLIEYDLSDGRHVKVEFSEVPDGVKVVETFEPEEENTEDMQRSGWQAILSNFKKYAEGKVA